MDFSLTLRQLAAFVAALIKLDPDATERLYQQLRVLARQGLISPTGEDVRQGQTARYDLLNLCVLRLLLVFLDLGFSPADLRRVRAVMLGTRFDPANPGTLRGAHAIHQVMEADAEADFSFVLELRRDRDSGERTLAGRFIDAGEVPEPKASEIINDATAVEASITVPATRLLAPILAQAKSDAG